MPDPKDSRDPIWAQLTRPFAADEIEKLPKNVRRDDQDRGTCERGSRYSADGTFCGKYHARAVHLDYVGHAGIVMRLNDVLGPDGWEFEPFAVDSDGLPIISRDTFYAKLTIRGATKWDLAANFTGPQEAYGDALRRCAMRFGIGTYLWSKSDAASEMSKAEPTVAPTAGELLDHDLGLLAEGIRVMVQERWPFKDRPPKTLNDDEVTQVRELVRTILAANLETGA